MVGCHALCWRDREGAFRFSPSGSPAPVSLSSEKPTQIISGVCVGMYTYAHPGWRYLNLNSGFCFSAV